MTTRRVLICNPRSVSDADLEAFVEWTKAAFAGRKLKDGSAIVFEFQTARDEAIEIQKEKPNLPFNWQHWVLHASGTVTPFSKEPRFHYYVVGPEHVMGRATAELVVRAHNAGRQVFARSSAGELVPVKGVKILDEENWKQLAEVEV
jgi:hypothetical protein